MSGNKLATTVKKGFRDACLGLVLFIVLALNFKDPAMLRPASSAAATGEQARLAALYAADPEPAAESAMLLLTALNRAADPLAARRLAGLATLGLSFSILVAFNLALMRHLYRVSALPRHSRGRESA